MSTNQTNAIKELETSLNIEILGTDKIELDIFGQINYLSLRNCKVKNHHLKLISSLTALEHLNLSDNLITEIKDLENLKSLEWLYLENNQITEIKGLDSFKCLWCLDLSNNQITEIDNLKDIRFLETIGRNGNVVTEVKDLKSLKSLKRIWWLSLEKNPIMESICKK